MTATARKIAVLFYNALRHGMNYVDPGASYYEFATESGSSTTFTAAPRHSASSSKRKTRQFQSQPFLRKART